MKPTPPVVLAVCMVLAWCNLPAADISSAQGGTDETEIRRLDQVEAQAVLAKDTVTLLKLWDKDYVVNNPDNKVVLAKANPLDRPVLKNSRAFFAREVEHVTLRGDVVISMGNETVIPAGDLPNSGQVVKRRYTHVWMKVDGEWKLVARHANVICQGTPVLPPTSVTPPAVSQPRQP